MPRRITQRGPLQQVTLRGKTVILAVEGDSFYPAVIPLSPVSAGPVDYAITCSSGSFTLTGSSVSINRNRALTASSGSYTYTGSQTTIKRNRALTASAGSYAYTGQTVTIKQDRLVTASAGSYSYTGQSVGVNHNRALTASAGSYALSGNSVDITYTPASVNYNIDAQPGSYLLTGSDVLVQIYASVSEKVGGDDAFHSGWDKQAWARKKKKEDALEATIRQAYLKAQGIEPAPEEVAEIVAEVNEAPVVESESPAVDYSGMAEWLAAQEKIVAQILAKRQEEDDEEALLMLL